MNKPSSLELLSLLALGTLVFGSGCAKSELLSKSCQASDDQKGSFNAKLEELPITLFIDSSFNHSQRQAAFAAATEWNRQAGGAGQAFIFDSKEAAVPASVRLFDANTAEGACAGGLGGTKSVYLVNVSDSADAVRVGLSGNGTFATTVQCKSDIYIRSQAIYFNTSVTPAAQVGSVMLHEMGHALGLKHSCAKGTEDDPEGAGYRACQGLAADHPYRTAVMYPWLSNVDPLRTGGAQILNAYPRYFPQNPYQRYNSEAAPHWRGEALEMKENLRENDKVRFNCLYGE